MDRAKTFLFIKSYVRSMRLYYAFITGIAGWIGVAFVRFLYPETTSILKSVIVLSVLFLSWGVNQIINDFLGLKEDRINAPHRPMVTGDLDARSALAVSLVLIAFSLLVTLGMSPWAAVPLVAGIVLNVAYEYAKGVPFLGNIIFGVMISMCTAYGYLAMSPDMSVIFTSSRMSVLFLVALMNGLMTYYTYFKDYAGDKASGKMTAVVLHGIEKSRKIAIIGSLSPSLVFAALKSMGYIEAPVNEVFIFLFIMTLFLQIWTGVLFYKYPTGPKAYYSLVTNFRACTCGQVMLIALFNKELALYLYIATYVFVGFLFNLHEDHKA
jgi:geranylgeranylglycerol-phosphate geranylgeranyltransferase